MLDSKEEKMLEMDQQLAQKHQIIKEMMQEKADRQARLEDLQGIKEDMTHDIRRRRDELQRLEHESGRARAELLSTKNQLKTLRQEMVNLAENERDHRELLEHQRFELTRLRKVQQDQIDSLNQLNSDLNYVRSEYGDLDGEVRRLDEIDKRARKELEYRKMRIEELMTLENQYTRELENLATARAEYSYTVDKLALMEERQRSEIVGLERRHSRLLGYPPGPGQMGPPPPPSLGGPMPPSSGYMAGPMTGGIPPPNTGIIGGPSRNMITGIPTTPFRSQTAQIGPGQRF